MQRSIQPFPESQLPPAQPVIKYSRHFDAVCVPLTTVTFSFRPHYGHNHATFIPGIDDLKHRLKEMGLVRISEGMLDEKVYTGTYSIPANNTFSLGNTILEKREINIEGEGCIARCGVDLVVVPAPNNDDCNRLFSLFITYHKNTFRIGPCMSPFPSWFIRTIMAPD